MSAQRKPPTGEREGTDGILWVHPGHSANCSSVGSVVDFLLMAGTAGAALLGVVAVLGRPGSGDSPSQDATPDSDNEEHAGREAEP